MKKPNWEEEFKEIEQFKDIGSKDTIIFDKKEHHDLVSSQIKQAEKRAKREILERLPIEKMNLGKTTDGEKFERGFNQAKDELIAFKDK